MLFNLQYRFAELDADYGKSAIDSVIFCREKDQFDAECKTSNRMTDIVCRKCSKPIRRKWRMNEKTVNFRLIIRALGKHGTLTARQIAENDGKSQRKKDLERRANTYNRTINGSSRKDDFVKGLIDKGLIRTDGQIHSKKPTRTYRLTPLGVLYFIRLFNTLKDGTMSPKHATAFFEINEDPLIESLVTNYKDYFPKVFGKWHIFKKLGTTPLDLFPFLEKIVIPLLSYLNMVQEAKSTKKESIEKDFTLWCYSILLTIFSRPYYTKDLKNDAEIQSWLSGVVKESMGAVDSVKSGLQKLSTLLESDKIIPDYDKYSNIFKNDSSSQKVINL